MWEFIQQLSDKLANRGQTKRPSKPVTGVCSGHSLTVVIIFLMLLFLRHKTVQSDQTQTLQCASTGEGELR